MRYTQDTQRDLLGGSSSFTVGAYLLLTNVNRLEPPDRHRAVFLHCLKHDEELEIAPVIYHALLPTSDRANRLEVLLDCLRSQSDRTTERAIAGVALGLFEAAGHWTGPVPRETNDQLVMVIRTLVSVHWQSRRWRDLCPELEPRLSEAIKRWARKAYPNQEDQKLDLVHSLLSAIHQDQPPVPPKQRRWYRDGRDRIESHLWGLSPIGKLILEQLVYAFYGALPLYDRLTLLVKHA